MNFWKKIIPKDIPLPLGRWNIDYSSKIIHRKIDDSNEDHCGPCGQRSFSPETKEKEEEEEKKEEEKETKKRKKN